MGKKGKGRQASGFGSKNLRAAHTLEWQSQVHQIVVGRNPLSSQPHRITGTSVRSVHLDKTLTTTIQRPRLTRLGQLKSILRERQFQESYEFLERRRRAGFVPSLQNGTDTPIRNAEPIHPPGWILQYGKKSSSDTTDRGEFEQPSSSSSSSSSIIIESLQSKCLQLLCHYILEYLEVMGKDELHTAFALLPAETLTKLSVAVSKRIGMTDDLVYAIGKHAHVEELCLRSKLGMGVGNVVTDQGLLELIPRLPSKSRHQQCNEQQQQGDEEEVLDDWETAYNDDDDNDDDAPRRHCLVVDALHLDGVSVGLKRLELLDCLDISADAVLALLEKCACITHLSIAGSFHMIEDGVQVMGALPDLLPGLRVLDVTRCNWMNHAILSDFEEKYSCTSRNEPPMVYCQGCLLRKGLRPGDSPYNLHDW